MDIIMLVFVAVLCGSVAAKIFNSEERNDVFNKKPIEVVDVKKYNKFCGRLVIGFAIVAEITLFIGFAIGGAAYTVSTLVLLLEVYIILKIYSKYEAKNIKKR